MKTQTAAGVRVATKLAADKLEIGASAVFQGAQAGDTQHHRQRSHLAHDAGDASARRSGAVAVGRSAAPAMLDRLAGRRQRMSEHLEARAWARETGSGFGVGQQLTADTGTRSAAWTPVTGSPSG